MLLAVAMLLAGAALEPPVMTPFGIVPFSFERRGFYGVCR
jgi:hypothetical protein